MRKLILAGCALALAGCAGLNADTSSAIRLQYATQLEAWNAAGLDPIQLDAQELLFAGVACGTLASISSVINPDAPDLNQELAAWCVKVVDTLAPA